MPRPSAPTRLLLAALLTLAPAGFAAQNHLLTGTQETPVFVNSSVGTDLLWENGFYGQGIIIANVEGGHVWSGHEVFDRTAINTALGITLPVSPALLVNAPVTLDAPELGEVDFHATMVGHVLVGAGTFTNTEGNLALTAVGAGMAPFATLWSGAIATRFGDTEETVGSFEISQISFLTPYVEFFGGATHGRADVINSSWGGDDVGGVGFETRAISALAAQNPSVTAVFSSGNTGPGADTVGGPGSSFNVITVGSSGGIGQLTPSDFSSGGPVSFYNPATGTLIPGARAAVHVLAPGEDLALAAYLPPTGGLAPLLTPEITTTANDRYFLFSSSGTSFASPTVAGGVGLLKELIKGGLTGDARTEALDARVIRSVIMASAVRTFGWNNGQSASGPGGSLLTTQALDYRAGAGLFNVGEAALLYVFGTSSVLGSGGASDLLASGWDLGAISIGEVNSYTLALPADGSSPVEFTVSLNWFVDERIELTNSLVSYGSFANLDVEVWRLGAGGAFETLLAASRTSYGNSEFLRFLVEQGGSLGLRVTFDTFVYDLAGAALDPVTYGLAWNTTAIPEPATYASVVGALTLLVVWRRRPVARR